MNMIETKIGKTSRRISIFLKVGSLLMLVVTALAVLGICILTFSGTETKESFLAAFNTTTSTGVTLTIIPQHLFMMFISMILYSLFMCIIFYNIHLVFKDVSADHTPFKHKHTVRIKRISLLIIVLSLIGSFSDGLFDLFTINKMAWHIDFSGIILGVIIYCLALFFDYGCELQQQSDETL